MMIPEDYNDLNSQADYSNSEDTAHTAGEADAAEFNERQFEDSVIAGQTDRETVPDANTDTARFNSGEQDQAINERENDVINEEPLTTQGEYKEIEENMGGTTNLTLDQLKKEHDPEGRNNA